MMKRLKKNYYPLPEAAERSGHSIDDFLYLAEHRQLMLSVEAHHWPIVWGDEREFPGGPDIDIEKPVKPPFDYYNSGYLNLLWYDIRRLRVDKRLSLTDVYAEKDGREFIGSIQRGLAEFRDQQHECELELSNIFIAHEELQRVINGKAGDWEFESGPTSIDAKIGNQATNNLYSSEVNNVSISNEKHDTISLSNRENNIYIINPGPNSHQNEGVSNQKVKQESKPSIVDLDKSGQKPTTQSRYREWQQKYIALREKYPDKSKTWIAMQIEKMPIAEGRNFHTIRKHMDNQNN
jgi:hypothetical protein